VFGINAPVLNLQTVMFRLRLVIKKAIPNTIGGKVKSLLRLAMVFACLMGLSACKTLDTFNSGSNPQVGPSVGPSVGPKIHTEANKKQVVYNSNIYLDMAIPVFDPGLPLDDRGDVDYDAVGKAGLWPQLRRAEANRFAVETKRAVEKLRTFGAVSVVPTATASADVYVLGRIDESDSEVIKLTVSVLDSQGKKWGKRQFEHKVAAGFFRDRTNDNKDPYGPVFSRIADYVYELLIEKSEIEKQTIKQITDLRYSQLYAPEIFSQHLKLTKTWNGNYEYQLLSLPNQNAAMVKRIKPLRVQDQLFVDRLQTQYEGFHAKSEKSYRAWQKETLPNLIAANKARTERNVRVGAGIALAALAVLIQRKENKKDSGSRPGNVNIGTVAGVVASTILISSAMDKNAELKVHKQSLDELGESLDLEISPQLMTHNDQTVELTGTANEQYEQWKNHLKNIYELEKTPDKQL
jgi:hypothetical protein